MSLRLRGLRRSVGGVRILDGVDLDAAPGEVLALLGPSGSGKTSTLRALAGLDPLDAGTVEINGVDRAGAPPERRGLGMVFQTWALWPHKTARENVAWPLQLRGDRAALAKADALLDRVQLGGLGGRPPHALSGGQQQRVALARALATDPQVLLLDEPLSSLDAGLREQMRALLLEIIRERRLTTVLVSHDPDEALGMADTIAVLERGRVVQVGPPADVYAAPASEAAARLLGPLLTVDTAAQAGAVTALGWAGAHPVDGPVRVGFRPEWLEIGVPGGVPAEVVEVGFRGGRSRVVLACAGLRLALDREGPAPPVGATLPLRATRACVWPRPG